MLNEKDNNSADKLEFPAQQHPTVPHFTEWDSSYLGISGLEKRRGVGQFTENFLNPTA